MQITSVHSCCCVLCALSLICTLCLLQIKAQQAVQPRRMSLRVQGQAADGAYVSNEGPGALCTAHNCHLRCMLLIRQR